MIKEIVNYIEDNTSFVVGTTLFAISDVVTVTDTCIIIAEPSAGLADASIDGLRQVPLLAYSRGDTQFTARDNAWIVFDLLHRKMQISLTAIGSGPVYVCNFRCNTPNYIGLDRKGRRYVYSVPINVNVTNML